MSLLSDALEAKRKPATPCAVDKFCQNHPDLADEIHEFLDWWAEHKQPPVSVLRDVLTQRGLEAPAKQALARHGRRDCTCR